MSIVSEFHDERSQNVDIVFNEIPGEYDDVENTKSDKKLDYVSNNDLQNVVTYVYNSLDNT